MKRSGLLISLVMVASVLAACTAPTPGAVSQTPASGKLSTAAAAVTTTPLTAATPAPTKPTMLRFPLAGDPTSLEPALGPELYTGWIAENLHARLLRYDENNQIVPYLAERYEVSPDSRIFTFYLRKDIKFQNGRSIVASDFKKSWERYLDPALASATGVEYLGSLVGAHDIISGTTKELRGFEIIDDHTFKVTTTEPDPGLIQRVASPFLSVVPAEAVVEGKPEWKDKPIGAGPYKFVEWKTNEKIVLEAWDGFFLGRPSVDRIEYRIVPDNATVLAQYDAGELDAANVTYSDLKRIEADPQQSKELHAWTRARLIFFCPSMDKVAAFKDKRVRQAFNYALNKKDIIDKLLFNAYAVATGYVPPSIPEYNPKLKGYEYDPDKARALLAEAGYPNGQGFPKLKVTSTGDLSTELEAFASQMKQNLGVNIEVETVERGKLFDGWFAHGTWDIFRWGWTADYPSAEVWLYQMLYTGVEANCSGYSNPQFDAVVDKARVALDPKERTALWQQAEEMAMEDAPMIPFGYDQYFYLVKPYVQGFSCNYAGPMWFKNVTIKQ
jgi:oligopeptide transport system substrate-binding protein